MEATEAPAMMLQADKTLLQPIRPHLIAYCPTMDLIAVVTEQETLDVYRLNGQRAFSHKRKNSVTSIDCICWKFNGRKRPLIRVNDLTLGHVMFCLNAG